MGKFEAGKYGLGLTGKEDDTHKFVKDSYSKSMAGHLGVDKLPAKGRELVKQGDSFFDSLAAHKSPDNAIKDKVRKIKERLTQNNPNQPSDKNNPSQNSNDSVKDKVQNLSEKLKDIKGDPRKMLAQVADEQFGLGEKIGTLLWAIWGVLAIAGVIVSLTLVGLVAGLPVIIIFNLLIVKPKWVYQLTLFILDLVGVGEAIQVAGKAGLDKVNIRLKNWQKISIIILDIVFVIGMVLVMYSIVSNFCSHFGGIVTSIAAAAADWWYGTKNFSQANDFCAQINKFNTDVFSGSAQVNLPQ